MWDHTGINIAIHKGKKTKREERTMRTRQTISRKLSDAVMNGKITVKDLCDALGINSRTTDASELWNEIITRYLALVR